MDEEGPTGPADQQRVEGSWLVLAYPDNPPIRFDARLLDRVLVDDRQVLLAAGEVRVALEIPHGVDAALDIAEKLAPFTRSAPITRVELYEDAKRRLVAAGSGQRVHLEPGLFFGEEAVWTHDGVLRVGKFSCWISDLEEYAERGETFALPGGSMQASLALLAAAAASRSDDAALLSRRIAAYEDREHERQAPRSNEDSDP